VNIIKSLAILFFCVALAALVAGGVVVHNLIMPVDTQNMAKVRFIVPKGQSLSKIGQRLVEAGLLRHPLVFRFYVEQLGVGQKIQAGSFQLSASMTPPQLITEMTKGTADLWVTLLEGWRREEMAAALSQQELANFDADQFLALTKDKEGYLFPDTYLIQRDFTTEQIISLLNNTFQKKVEKGLDADIKASGKSLKDIMIMASILQREAKGADQMKLIAGILWKRIDIGMGLNVDAALQYARGYDAVQKSWWSPPLTVDKERPTPYNTYQSAGLPPTPISNPGLDAIQAALHPVQTDYLYYLHDPKGKVHFAKTLDEHNANVRQFLR